MARYDEGPVWTEDSFHTGDHLDDVTYAESAPGRMRRDIERIRRNPHIRDHLSENERIRVGTRQHPIVLIVPTLATVAAFAIFIYMVTHDGTVLLSFMVLVACALWLGWRWLNWQRNYFLATDHRVLKIYGVISTTVDSMKVQKVTDMTYRRGIWGEILGYGSITIESAGQDQALHDIEYIPYPRENYQELCHIIIGDDPRDGGTKKHRLLRRLERLIQGGGWHLPQFSQPAATYPDDHYPPERDDELGSQPSPRMLYSSHEARRADTSPIPIYPPGHFTSDDRADDTDHSDSDSPPDADDIPDHFPSDWSRDGGDDYYPDFDDPTRN